MCLRSCRHALSSIPISLSTNRKNATQAATLLTIFLLAITCSAQDQPQNNEPASQPSQERTDAQNAPVTIPAGTSIALVLTHPIQSRYVRRGDDIYAQTTSPVNSGNEVVIPQGTFVQGKVDKLDWNGGRAQIRLQSMSITFPDGYVATVAGPVTLQSDEGYALKDPGKNRIATAVALPAAGAGVGALIGHVVANSQPSTITSSLPPGCTGPPPGCISSSLTVPGSTAKSTFIGAAVGGGAGMFAALALMFSSHHFFLDVWSPVEMVLQRPVILGEEHATNAVPEELQHPVTEAVASSPLLTVN